MDEPTARIEAFRSAYQSARDQISRVMVGQQRVIDAALTAIFCGGNVLLEGLPGLGKTELVKAMANTLDLDYRRIQFTPDLMPADIIGTSILATTETGAASLEFRPGPIFTQLLLGDEINRATPKTQAALLETMQEGTVTTGGKTYELKPPFFVIATQNPIEQEGTYPLPEAQLDRFLFKVDVTFPNRNELNEILNRTSIQRIASPEKVLSGEQILELRETLRDVVVDEKIRDYAVRLVLATHPETESAPDVTKKYVKWGASPRACQGLVRAARVRAVLSGRAHVACEDIREYAPEILGHRILLNYDGQAEGITPAKIISAALRHTPDLQAL